MPNYCSNYLTVTGTPEDVKLFMAENINNKDLLDFQSAVPVKINEAGDYVEDVYAKWGTRANPAEWGEMALNDESDKGCITCSFDTAWAPPIIWLEVVVGKYPKLNFELSYEEGGCGVYGVSTGTNGVFNDCPMEKDEWLMESNEEYPEYVEAINQMSQEELIKYFSGIHDFQDCCTENKEWPESLVEEKDWNEGDSMYDFYPLAKVIIQKIEPQNLPLFMSVDWGLDEYNKMFKERISKGE